MRKRARLGFWRHGVFALAAGIVLSAAPRAGAVEVILDGTMHLRASELKSLGGGMVSIILSQALHEPLVVPSARVECVAGDGCPTDLVVKIADKPVGPGFEIQGSNTIGEKLMPELVKAFLKKAYRIDARQPDSDVPDQKTITFQGQGGALVEIKITAKGTGTGFEPLLGINQPQGLPSSQIWMASRKANEKELQTAKGQKSYDLTAEHFEHVIALDGLGIIVNSANPLNAITVDEIAQIFSGKLTRWESVPSLQVSGKQDFSGAIKVYRRDNNSGTTATVNDLVFKEVAKKDPSLKDCADKSGTDPGACFAPEAKTFTSSEELETAVTADRNGIGFIGIGYRSNTKALGVVVTCGQSAGGFTQRFAYYPSEFNIKVEEYPLARRLYLYTLGQTSNPLAQKLVDFAESEQANQTLKKLSFFDQSVTAAPFNEQGERFAAMIGAATGSDPLTQQFLDDARFATRLSTTLRFADNDATLDTKAKLDLDKLAVALNTTYKGRQFLIMGFSDDAGGPDKALEISKTRALAVANALKERFPDVYNDNAKAYGSAAPVACNSSDPKSRGNALNRRVEVWVK